jgi:hypothetical protein
MLKWLLAMLALLFPINFSDDTDYTGEVAAEAAYASLLPDPTAVKPKGPTKDCKTCNGTGRVRTGDDQGWTKCPDCEGIPGATPWEEAPPKAEPTPTPTIKTPKSEPDRYVPKSNAAPTILVR